MKVLTKLEMSNNEVQNVIIHKVSTDPLASSKDIGKIIYNSTTNKLKYYNGRKWVELVESDDNVNVTIDTALSDESQGAPHVPSSIATVNYIKQVMSGLDLNMKTLISECPAISGSNSCTWNIILNHKTPASIQVYENNELVFPIISQSASNISITFKGISNIEAGRFKTIIIYKEA